MLTLQQRGCTPAMSSRANCNHETELMYTLSVHALVEPNTLIAVCTVETDLGVSVFWKCARAMLHNLQYIKAQGQNTASLFER